MSISPGSRLGQYEVQSALGAGDAAASGPVSNQSATMTVVLNWVEELKSLLPGK